MLRLTCQGHGTKNFEFVSVSSYIARSCFGLSVCPEVPVESCFFVMSGYTYKTEVHALHGMNKHVSARTTVKGAAKCDQHCELQDSANQQEVERILLFG